MRSVELPAWAVAAVLVAPLCAIPLLDSGTMSLYATVMATLYAAVSGVAAWLAVRDANKDRKERTRPVVQADCIVSSASETFFRLANTGGGPAEHVQVAFSPSPVDFDGKRLSDHSLFRAAIPVLMPMQEVKHLFQLAFNFSRPDVPAVFDATVSYRSRDQKYSETTHVDMSIYADLTLPRPTIQESATSLSKSAVEIVKLLERLVQGRERGGDA